MSRYWTVGGLNLLVLLIGLTGFSPDGFGGNKFRYLGHSGQSISLPTDLFVYLAYDLETQKMHYGYAADQVHPDRLPAGEVNALRNGGHVALALKALQIKDASTYGSLYPHGKGRIVGGGIIRTAEGTLLIHPMMSLKAAGAVLNNSYINGRLPQTNHGWRSMIPEVYARAFFEQLIQDLDAPFELDHSFDNQGLYRINTTKHRPGLESTVFHSSYWLSRVLADLNQHYYDIPLPDDFAESALKKGNMTTNYNADLIAAHLLQPGNESQLKSLLVERYWGLLGPDTRLSEETRAKILAHLIDLEPQHPLIKKAITNNLDGLINGSLAAQILASEMDRDLKLYFLTKTFKKQPNRVVVEFFKHLLQYHPSNSIVNEFLSDNWKAFSKLAKSVLKSGDKVRRRRLYEELAAVLPAPFNPEDFLPQRLVDVQLRLPQGAWVELPNHCRGVFQ